MTGLRERMRAGQLLVGTMISEVRNPNIAHMLAQCGYDYFILDNEHGAYSPETVSDMVAGARGAALPVIVRIPEIRRETILKPLDSGATGLLVPQVHTVEQAKEIIRHAKYPPMGDRGAALRRAHSRYRKPDAEAYLKQANEETVIVVQAESQRAVDNLDEIISVSGIDAVLIGPFDLSVSLGLPGQVGHPSVREAIENVVNTCTRAGVPCGIHLFDVESLKLWIERGMRFVSYSGDISMLSDVAAEGLKELKKKED